MAARWAPPGLDDTRLASHIASDIGAAAVAKRLSATIYLVNHDNLIAIPVTLDTSLGWPPVQAIREFVQNHMISGYERASSTKQRSSCSTIGASAEKS